MTEISPSIDHNLTQLLKSWNSSDSPEKTLSPILYETLRRLSKRYIQQEKQGYTLQATELVHEAYVRLIDSEIDWKNRHHFYAVAAKTMRRILVDRAREKNAEKRGQAYQRVTFYESHLSSDTQGDDILALNDAIEQLEQQDARKAEIVQLYYFAGLTYNEISLCMELSEATIDRELRFSKAWLGSRIQQLD